MAYFLPQFYAFPENDEWWGKGFTEWTKTKRAFPFFKGHNQPRIPHDDIGYYDLSDVQTLRNQVKMAQDFGLYGFCFYYYNFGNGIKLMEKPLLHFLENKEINFPFMLMWCTQTWNRSWDSNTETILVEQMFDDENNMAFIKDIEKYLEDPRYIKINGKPILNIYHTEFFLNFNNTINMWQQYRKNKGLSELYITVTYINEFKGSLTKNNFYFNIDALQCFIETTEYNAYLPQFLDSSKGVLYDYKKIMKTIYNTEFESKTYPFIFGEWDNFARRQNKNALIFLGFSNNLFYRCLKKIIKKVKKELPKEEQFIFIDAWNEWAEGTYLEPDKKRGYALLNAVGKALTKSKGKK